MLMPPASHASPATAAHLGQALLSCSCLLRENPTAHAPAINHVADNLRSFALHPSVA